MEYERTLYGCQSKNFFDIRTSARTNSDTDLRLSQQLDCSNPEANLSPQPPVEESNCKEILSKPSQPAPKRSILDLLVRPSSLPVPLLQQQTWASVINPDRTQEASTCINTPAPEDQKVT